uniref:Fatty acid hydroxylase domain-containing protein n=1 Tax=viral metagenome TaxID=1070528 RepID=A0A6C0ARR6_9ZZZZ
MDIIRDLQLDSQIYTRKDSFIKNQIKLGIINAPLYATAFVIVLLINYKTDRNIFIAIFSFYFVSSWSYFTHLFAHQPIFRPLGQFHLLHHDETNHDSSVVFLIEALIDFFVFGGFLLIPIGHFVEKLIGFRIFNYYIILMWSIFYLTYHLLNYHFTKPDAHKEHHISSGISNYGPEWMDIYFDTKTEGSIFENLNSGAVNLIIATGLILWLKDTEFDLTKMQIQS